VFATSVLRGAGDSKTPLYFLILSVILDIGLNPVFIFGIGPIPRMEIAGSALATLLAQAISLVVLIAWLYLRKNPLMLHSGEFGLLRMDWSLVRTLVVKGVPLAMQMVVGSLSMALMITLVNRFGIDTIAAYGAAQQLWNYIQMPSFAISMAVSSMAAQNIGAQLWDRVATITRVGIVYQLLLTGTLVAIVELVGGPALGLFLPSGSPALAIGLHMNAIVASSFIFFGIALVMFGVVRANGAVMAPLAILFITLLGVRFPIAWLLLDHWHGDAVWWSFPVSSVLAVILAFIHYNFGRWREARMMAPDAAIGAETPF
jgi:putative MATE family efflux protein